MKPLYYKTRLESSKEYAAGEWVTVEVPFSAKKAVTQLRVDFMQELGEMEIEEMRLLRGGDVVWEAEF